MDSDAATGLHEDEAKRRLAELGPNELREAERRSPWLVLASQFANTMIAVLAVAAVVTWVIGERTDTVVIGAIVVINAAIGFVQEYRAERAMESLRQLTSSRARVVRDGSPRDVPATEVVPGDLVRLAAGDVVAADVRLTNVQGMRIDEAALTGESETVSKISAALDGREHVGPADLTNMAFKGTAVTSGRAEGIVVATGMGTEIGRIAALLGTGARATTPLQQRLAVLGRLLASAALAVCAVVFVSGIATGEPAEEMFLIAVSLAVAAIPEGLPAVVTVSLALGARRMAEHRALIRRLPAVETLGSVTVVCTDKTGTLTENRMTVERVWTPNGTYTVRGRGYDPVGEIGGMTGPDDLLHRLALIASLCNDANLRPPEEPDGEWVLAGDPTEGALLALAGRLGIDHADVTSRHPRVAEVPFDAERRKMLTIHRAPDGVWVAVKGALEAIMEAIGEPDASIHEAASMVAEEFAGDGFRVLAFADAVLPGLPDDPLDAGPHLRLVGLAAIADPPRPEVREAIGRCRTAGITPVMITGDHPHTAASIGRRLGLLDSEAGGVMTGAELATLDDDTLADRIRDIRIFARTAPEQKVRIVDAWRSVGEVVAMTGDGVNDAPALQMADIGVAMGITGTDVAQQAADMVLADDNFATIVAAAQEGRRIYDNLRRFVRYLLTTNSGEVLVMLLAPLFGLPIPLTPAQILWINLVTDGLPAVALGLEPAEAGVMDRPPRPATESVLGRGLWQQALAVGLLMAVLVIPLQFVAERWEWPSRTMVFTTLALLQLGNALASRSERDSLRHLGIRTNPWLAGAVALGLVAQLAAVYVPGLQVAFDTEPLTFGQLAIVLAVSTGALLAVEAHKWWLRGRAARPCDRRTSRSKGPGRTSLGAQRSG